MSNYDRNIFSALDDRNNTGRAFLLGAVFNHDRASLFGKQIGRIDWQLNWRQRQARFEPMDRQYNPEYNYKWNLPEEQLTGDENFVESSLNYFPRKFTQVSFDAGMVERGQAISTHRGKAAVLLSDSTFLKGDLFAELISSENYGQRSDWQRAGGSLGRRIWKMLPYGKLRREDRRVRDPQNTLTGFRFTEGGGGLKLFSLLGMDWDAGSVLREDYLYDPHHYGRRLRLAVSHTHQLALDIRESRSLQGRLSFAYRDKNYEPFFEHLPADSMAVYQPDPQFQDTTWGDRQSHLGNVEIQYRNRERTIDSRWEYRIASELQALQEKVFLEVGENRGNYRYDPELKEYVPDPQGNYFLIIVPTGNFESVTNVEASWQLRYRPRVSKEKKSGWGRILNNISTFTYLKVDEKSREQNIWQLYLLNLEK